MKILITHPNTKGLLGEIMTRINLIEVKGDSTEQLFYVRLGLKELVESIKEIPDDEEEVKNNKDG
jgi:hypothetical protein